MMQVQDLAVHLGYTKYSVSQVLSEIDKAKKGG